MVRLRRIFRLFVVLILHNCAETHHKIPLLFTIYYQLFTDFGGFMRVGHGYDVHLFMEGRRLVLGGVEIPCEKGLLGHSDADVLIHAVMDSLLGAAGLGDIGRHFPDTDEQYKDISSLALLDRVVALIEQEGYRVENIDCTVIMLAPKIAPYTEQMKSNIAAHCHITPQQVNVKATTEEGAGLGERAAGAHAVCLLDGGGGFFGALFT